MIDYSDKQILLLEDNADDAVFFQRSLPKEVNEKAIHLTNGQQAYEFLSGKGEFERSNLSSLRLILIDLKMPLINGLELLQLLKKEKLHERTPKVIFTSSSHPRDIEMAYELGACAYLAKPTSITDYKRVVESIIGFWMQLNIFQ